MVPGVEIPGVDILNLLLLKHQRHAQAFNTRHKKNRHSHPVTGSRTGK